MHSCLRRRALALAVTVAALAALPGPTSADEPVRCAGQIATIVGGEGPDSIPGTSGRDVIAALGGNDRVAAGPGDDVVCLGDGNDALNGGAGNDVSIAEASADGDDSFAGGLGARDSVRYDRRRSPLAVSLDNVPDDGQVGERDNNHIDVENVVGGRAGDDVNGGAAGNSLNGGPGADSLSGLDGNDELIGGSGDDVLDGGHGHDSAVASAAPDGADLFQGGLGRDTASYVARSESVHVTLDLSANDGAPGEGDNVGGNVLDVEQVVGGSANDVLTLEFVVTAPVTLRGGPGNDVISTEAIGIGDTADGGPDGDTCRTDASDFRISCER
jgi:RTX calcium-binding nonapeptide repeat (4 copies)